MVCNDKRSCKKIICDYIFENFTVIFFCINLIAIRVEEESRNSACVQEIPAKLVMLFVISQDNFFYHSLRLFVGNVEFDRCSGYRCPETRML